MRSPSIMSYRLSNFQSPRGSLRGRRLSSACRASSSLQLAPNQETNKLKLKNLTRKEIEDWCASLGEENPTNRAMQIWRLMYADDHWIQSFEETRGKQGGFSDRFTAQATEVSTLDGGLVLKQVVRSSDGTRKMAFTLKGTSQVIETVLIPVIREAGQRRRITLCVSSQVGCAMNCQFCFTGRMGLLSQLTTAQIVQQIIEAKRLLAEEEDDTPLTNLVFMGMGEPLNNLEAVTTAIEIMKCPLGLHLSHNKVTVSTVGLVPEMHKFLSSPIGQSVQLALSLHATTDEVRDWIVPVNRTHNLASLMDCLAEHFPINSVKSVLIEYVMLKGINDTDEDATRLLSLLGNRIKAKINLICFNPHSGTRFQPSEVERVKSFRSILIQGGRVCTVRDSRGDDEMAACGQLGDLALSSRQAPILEPPARFRAQLSIQPR